jgi:hypothetical protein
VARYPDIAQNDPGRFPGARRLLKEDSAPEH